MIYYCSISMTHRHVSFCREYKSIFGDKVALSIPEIKVPIEYYRKGSPSQVIASDSFTYIVQIKFSNRLLYVPIDFTVSQLVKTMLVQLDYSEDSEYFVYFDGICFVASDASDELIPLESKEASLVNSLENWFHQLFVCVFALSVVRFTSREAFSVEMRMLPHCVLYPIHTIGILSIPIFLCSFIHLTISFDHDYLLVEVHSGTSYAEIRFQIVNLFRYYFKTDEQENDLRFVHQGGLASSDFPLVIMTVEIWFFCRFRTRSKCKCERVWRVGTVPRSSTLRRTFSLPPRLTCIAPNV